MDPEYNEAIQVAGKAYNARTLEPYPAEEGGEFESLMKPLYPERLEDAALDVNKKTRDELSKAPDQKMVWNQFVEWVGKFKKKGRHPIAAGKNIRTFDLKFAEKLCELHCQKGRKTKLFDSRIVLDLDDLVFNWFEDSDELPNHKMDTLRPYFGLSSDGAHDALVDVRQTGELIFRFLNLHRELRKRRCADGSPFIKFKREPKLERQIA